VARGSRVLALAREEALAIRLWKHHLHDRAPVGRWLQVVSEIGGLQVQSASAARLALWTRVADFSPDLLEEALNKRRTMLKVYGMRGTVHALPAKDWPQYFTALQHARRGDTLDKRGLRADDVARALHTATRILSTGPVTLKELAARFPRQLRDRLVSSGPYPWIALVKDLLRSVSVCFGPPRGQGVTFVTTERWLGRRPRGITAATAARGLARRYLRAFGPASAADFAYWSGLPAGDALRAFDQVPGRVEANVEGERLWMLPADRDYRKAAATAAPVRLLPDFDTYLLGHHDKSLVLDARHHRRVFSGAGRVAATVLQNGRVVATWRSDRGPLGLSVSVIAFQQLPVSVRRSIDEEVTSLAAFLETPLSKLTISRFVG